MLEIGGVTAEAGKKKSGFLTLGKAINGSPLGIPFHIVKGSEDGPTLCIEAAMHGNEYEGVFAISRFVRDLDPSRLRGTLVAIPVLNMPAFEARDRVNPNLYDRVNISRIFPGKREGTLSQRIVYTYVNEFLLKADYAITCHGGGDYISPMNHAVLEPVVNEFDKIQLELAKVFGCERVAIFTKAKGQMAEVLRQKGIHQVGFELGGQTATYDQREYYVNIFLRGFANVMKHLNMLDGEPILPKKQYIVEASYWDVCSNTGLWVPKVKVGDLVKKGDDIGTIFSPYTGDEVERFKASEDGMVLGLSAFPIIGPSDEFGCIIGKIVEIVEN
jgi:predicted deacylase